MSMNVTQQMGAALGEDSWVTPLFYSRPHLNSLNI